MKPWTENTAGSVALRWPRCGAAFAAPAAEMTFWNVPPPKLLFSVLKLGLEAALAGGGQHDERDDDAEHGDQERDVLPAERRLGAADQDEVCSATMTRAPARIQPWLVSKELPQLISVSLWARLPPATSAGPSAKTEKNLAK